MIILHAEFNDTSTIAEAIGILEKLNNRLKSQYSAEDVLDNIFVRGNGLQTASVTFFKDED